LARKEQTIFAELDEQRRQLESEEKEVDLALERTA
jgi:hypothetical protein